MNRVAVISAFTTLLYVLTATSAFAQTAGDGEHPADSIQQTQKEGQTGDLKSKVEYSANDSIRFDVEGKKILLWGNAKINYETTQLEAPYIEIDWTTNTLHAETRPDSSGKDVKPVFADDGENFTARQIDYNFTTKKGRINEVITSEGDGYVHGQVVKKDTNDVYYIHGGDYTTCDLEHPHFSLHASKLKVIPNNKIITGPAYLVIEDVPTPLALPFGLFPNKKEQRSGILMPSYGETKTLGFSLRDGGYFFAINDYINLQVRGDVYSLGSWGLRTASNYAVRYRFRGTLSAGYSSLKFGEKEFPDYSERNDFFIRWNHSVDAKALPGSQFSANVNITSSDYYRNNSLQANEALNNDFSSSIAYSKSFRGTPFNMNLNLRHHQNVQSHQVELSLPQLTLTMNRLTPKPRAGKKGLFSNAGISYTMSMKNDINLLDTIPLSHYTLRDTRKGIRHSIPLSNSFRVFKYFTWSQSAQYNEYWYFETTHKDWDPETHTVQSQTVQQFSAARDWGVGTSLNTKVYGMVGFGKNAWIQAIRHVATPSVGMSWRPDFSKPGYGYYNTVQRDTIPNYDVYSIYEQGMFGGPAKGKSGLINFGVQNNVEMKVRPAADDTTGQAKKIKLIDNLSVSTAYNLAADSIQWQPINIQARATPLPFLNVTFGSAYSPYVTDTQNRTLNRLEILENKRLARLVNMRASIDLSLSHKGAKTEGSTPGISPGLFPIAGQVDFSIPWTLRMNYIVNYTKQLPESTLQQTLAFNGDLSLTPKWKASFYSGYDLTKGQFSYTTITINRDLHCWEMSFFYIPFGSRQSYNLSIRVKAPVLQDLKITKRKDWVDQSILR
ncbi:MAG: LPS-assembly protein LptD [Flavobacteriales bacterium]|nr:LPS-assembly protein LptD [Flavobacteriales bacterium]MCB9448864.1 LPS-assembly protein LptD [Flavobacteriales bacterium]